MEGEKIISVLVLNKNEELVKIIPHTDVYDFDQTLPRNQSDTLNANFKLTEANLNLLKDASFLAVSDNQGGFFEYKIQNVTTSDTTIDVSAVGALWDELNSYGYIKDKRPNEATATDLIDLVLDGTRIQRGYTAPNLVSNPQTTSTSFYYETRLQALTEILEMFNLDIFFKIKLANNKISQRLIDVYDIYAIDNGRRFNYGTNALSVTFESDVSSIYTALVGRGSGIALTDDTGAETGGYSRKITFADVEWSLAKGDPVDKPKGQEFVELPSATQIYGFSDGKPRIGFIEFDDEEDPKKLLAETYDSLVKVAYPQVQFKATVGDVGMMTPGEVVTIRRKDLGILYQTRVEKVVWNRTNENLSQIEIGTTSYKSLSDTISNLTNQVNSAKDKSDSAERNSNWAIENGGSVISYGTSEPTNPAQDDLWYRFNDDGTITMLRYEDGQWVIVIDDATGQAIQNQIDEAVKEIDNAKVLADTANRTAQKAQDDATNALDNLTVIDNKVTELSSSVTEQINTLNDGYQQILVNEDGLTNQITNITGILDSKVASDQYETDRLQTDKTISDVVKGVAGNTTQINQLSDNINLMVQKDDIINQINISKEGILIAGEKVHITGQTVIDNAVIKDAMIGSVSADKLTAGTINANLINVINLNGANIVANTITGDKMTADAIQVGFQRMGSTIRISPTELSFWNGGNRSLSLQKDGMHIIDSNNAEDVGLIHTNHLVGHPEYNGLNFDLNAKGDYMAWGSRASNDTDYDTRLAWVRAGMASNTNFSAGLNIVDQVTFGKGIHVEGVPALMNFKKVTFNGGTYPYLGNDNIKAGFLYGTTQIYMSSDGIAYNLTKVIKALAGLSGKYSLITSFEKNSAGKDTGVAKTWTYVTF